MTKSARLATAVAAACGVFVSLGPAQGSRPSYVESALLAASDGRASEHFGRFLAFEGDTIAIGAANASVAGVQAQGAAAVLCAI